MPDAERKRMDREDAVGLLESVGCGLAKTENPSFDEKRTEGRPFTIIPAAHSALKHSPGLAPGGVGRSGALAALSAAPPVVRRGTSSSREVWPVRRTL